jgi:hypothetical protein
VIIYKLIKAIFISCSAFFVLIGLWWSQFKQQSLILTSFSMQVPDIIDNAYVIVEFDNGSRGMLDLCMFAEGSRNEQEISVVGDIGKVQLRRCFSYLDFFVVQLRSNTQICHFSEFLLCS